MFIGFMFGQIFIPVSFVYYANMIFMFLMIGLLIMSLLSRKNIIPRSFSMNFVYVFTFIDGILTYPLLQYYLEDLGKNVFTSILVASIVLFSVLAKIASRKELGYYIELGDILFDSLYINKERPINIMCKMNISKSTYYDMKEKLIFKVIIYPKFIRDMYDSYLF